MSETWTVLLGLFLGVYIALCAVFIATRDHTPIATKANRACETHQGVTSNGIHVDYFICRDGYVVER